MNCTFCVSATRLLYVIVNFVIILKLTLFSTYLGLGVNPDTVCVVLCNLTYTVLLMKKLIVEFVKYMLNGYCLLATEARDMNTHRGCHSHQAG
ncbi:unnamed protein product [Arctia plantaginis]|uniref:Uncharacterized protein n=1 Tax=Arctia plantaginis TaxID=874455 RepID=A0A8S1A3S1_ARCPL|nr:unnamed protein product [Arctia plantaginis]